MMAPCCGGEPIEETKNDPCKRKARVPVIDELVEDKLERKGDQQTGAHLGKRQGDGDHNEQAVALQVAKQEADHRYGLRVSSARQVAISPSMADSSCGRGLLRR